MFHLFVVVVAHFTGCLPPQPVFPFFQLSVAQVWSPGLSTPLLATFLLLLTPDCVKSPRSKLRERKSDQDAVLFKPQLCKIIFFKQPDTQYLAILLLYSGLVKTKICCCFLNQWLFRYCTLVWEKRKSVQ